MNMPAIIPSAQSYPDVPKYQPMSTMYPGLENTAPSSKIGGYPGINSQSGIGMSNPPIGGYPSMNAGASGYPSMNAGVSGYPSMNAGAGGYPGLNSGPSSSY